MKKYFNIFAVLLLLIGTMAPSFIYALDTGFQNPDTGVSPNDWNDGNGNKAETSDNVYANTNDDNDAQGYRNFDLGVPAGSIINGIEVAIEAKQEGETCQLQVALSHNNGANYTSNKTLVPTSTDSTLVYGSSVDTWGRSWTAPELANAQFRLKITFNDPDNDCITTAQNTPHDDIFVDLIQVKVHYTAPETDATVVAHKIVCNDESLLPNWGAAGGANITSSTAQDFVTANTPNCWFAPDRSFQWGNDNVTNPGDTYYGAAGDGWNTFGVTNANGMTTVDIPVGDNDHLWIREVLQDGYIPFTYGPSEGNSNNVSAEIYCSSDVINYDNFDKINSPEAGETYYCVAFNAEVPAICGDDEVNQESEQCDGTANCNENCGCNEGYRSEQGNCVALPACGDGNVDRVNYLTKIVQIEDIQIPLGEECDDGNTVDGDGCSSECTIEYVCEFEENTGWYGQYYNYLSTHPDMNLPQNQWNLSNVNGDPESNVTPWNTDWYNNTYFKFAQVDSNLEFGPSFFPFDATPDEVSGNGHEHHFGVHWSAQTYITNTGTYNFTMTTDDDIWVYIDGVLVDETTGIHPATVNAFSVALNPGTHIFDIYYADRHTVATHMYFTSLDQLTFVPYNENCNEEDPICGNGTKEGNEECDDENTNDGDGCSEICEIETCVPGEELVYNGGFEEPALDAGTWSIIPNIAGGWTVEQAGTDTPDGLEIQNSLWTPYGGAQYAELDGNLSTEISQVLTTIPGQNYSLNFALSARPGVVISSNGIEVYWNGVLVAPTIVLDGSANSDTSWSTYSYNVLATTSSSTLLIKDGGVSDTLGMFVDNVSVTCPTEGGDGDGDGDGDYEPECGDGVVQSYGDYHEACDDGNDSDTDGCTTTCEVATCGDGIVQNYEQGEVVYTEACDDGNDLYNDGCNSYCEVDQICEVPVEDSDAYAEAVAACTPQMEEDTMYSRVMKKLSLVDMVEEDFDQCIINYFCDDECIDTYNGDYNVYANENSVANTPLVTTIDVEVGDFLTITTIPGDTWSAGADDRTSDAAGLIAGNPYGGNYGLYNNGTAEFPYGALVGRTFGGSLFLIGTGFAGTMTEAGLLELMYWDSNYEDNTDLVYVDIVLERAVMCDEDSFCGDGFVDEGEECDDGNDVNGDSCKNNCTEPSDGGGSSCTINCDGDDTPDELLRTGGDGDGDTDEDEPKDKPRTSTPLTFGPQSSIALQLPAMLAATGATVQSTSMWMVLFVLSALGLAAVASSSVISKK